MKFWRHSLITVLAFIAVSFTVVYTSCTDDPCTKVKCRNGGTCVDGYCKCTVGWEGNMCQNKASDRYIGFYEGTVTIDGNPPVIDSALISPGSDSLGQTSSHTIYYLRYTRQDDVIKGTVGADGKIIVTDNKFGGRIITIIEEGEKIVVTSIEKPDGKEQTIKFVGTKTR